MILTHYGAWWTPIGKYTGKVNYPGVLVSKEDYEAQTDSVKRLLDENNYTTVKATDSTEYFLSDLSYSDFTLTFEPFDTIPKTFDFKAGDNEDVFVISNISLK